ncbi:lipid-binding SYLF domain-containing protein [uncultured Campylobacter sp.]|mgnify:FL=1|uniref:lipid-binding SYLF domain-containing protein n=1 Tax=uncultured Campylobacter sp. TaxID=218934 RepID=UPI00262A033B|nr:lipid-binding SYLF domain-containing protein [uncultured Campylobacter sp.]
MKKFIIALFLLFNAAFADDELIINSASAYSSVMRTNSQYKYLAQQARAIVIFPSVKKLGFIIGGMYGEGIIVYNNDGARSVSGAEISSASVGLQIGYEDNYLVIFVMNDDVIEKMRKSQITLSGDATAVAGNYSADSGALDVLNQDMYVFTNKGGLFAGVSLGGSVLETKNDRAFDPNTEGYALLMRVIGADE